MSDKFPAALVVSIHDVSPLTRELVESMLRELQEWGVKETSLLVIPDHHHRGHFGADGDFCAWLREKVSHGHEAVIHGYYHQRPERSSDSGWHRLITQFYTAGEGEFYDLEENLAFERMEQAKKDFSAAGLPPATGFIAPAWLLGKEAENAAKKAGFEYTTRIDSLLNLQSGAVCRSQSLVYSVRAGWRRQMSLIWNSTLYSMSKKQPLLRLGLHPPDYKFPQIWKQIHTLVTRALAVREAISYQTWMKRGRLR